MEKRKKDIKGLRWKRHVWTEWDRANRLEGKDGVKQMTGTKCLYPFSSLIYNIYLDER